MQNDHIDFRKGLVAQKAVILTRVSSKEQEEGYSIDAQKHRLETYCRRRNLTVIQTFDIVESSTKGDRKHFMAMIKFAKAQKQPIAIVADKVDRVQRSFTEFPLLDQLIQQGKIELHFNTENYVIHQNSVSQERMSWSMSVIMAQSYTDSIRDNVKRSFEHKIRMGEWISIIPSGYMTVPNDRGKNDIIPDPNKAPLMRKLFKEYATGIHTLQEIVALAKDWGLRSKSGNPYQKPSIYRMLNNPFYYGQMKIKGQLYSHKYEPLITKRLFDRCQAVMHGWKKKPFKYGGKEYVFRGILTCAISGKIVTADTKKKTYANGNTAEWTYLRCWDPNNPDKKKWVREDKVLEQVEKVLRSLHIPSQTLEKVKSVIRETDKSERAFQEQQVKELQRNYTVIQNRLDKLMDLLLDGVIEKDDFNKKRNSLREKQIDTEEMIKNCRVADDNFKDSLISLISMISNTHQIFIGSTIEKKRQLINFVFANLQLEGENLRFSLRKPFDQFIKCSDLDKWYPVRDSNPCCRRERHTTYTSMHTHKLITH